MRCGYQTRACGDPDPGEKPVSPFDVASVADRPGLVEVGTLQASFASGDYDTLVIGKLDRLSLSVVDFGNIRRTATKQVGA